MSSKEKLKMPDAKGKVVPSCSCNKERRVTLLLTINRGRGGKKMAGQIKTEHRHQMWREAQPATAVPLN